MSAKRVLVFLVLMLSLMHLKAQDTIPARDSVPLRDTVPIRDSLKTDSLLVDSVGQVNLINRDSVAAQVDTVTKKKHSPRKAAIRSAIIPGWGQVYNKKIWKVPIVYAAIGIPIGTFIYNKNWYTKTRDAARMIASNDTANYKGRVDPQLWVFFSTDNAIGSLLNYRNEFRRNMDYSILITLLFWGLNVVDATVDAHLKDFDVSDDLSLRIKPTLINYSTPGVSFVFTIGKHSNRTMRNLY